MTILPQQLTEFGVTLDEATRLAAAINPCLASLPKDIAWQKISRTVLSTQQPVELHLFIFKSLFPQWPDQLCPAPVWAPDHETRAQANLTKSMAELHKTTVELFHQWTVKEFPHFWEYIIRKLNVRFKRPPEKICDLSRGREFPQWLVGATLNIAESCFNAPAEKAALIFKGADGALQTQTYGELNQLSNRVANGLVQLGLQANDAIAINMPMTAATVAIYLGIIKMGGTVVSIADSFSVEEILARLSIIKTKAVFTQEFILRDEKALPLYEKIISANGPRAIVLPSQLPLSAPLSVPLRADDLTWADFLIDNDQFTAVGCHPNAPCNILFSSGTTGKPKAIAWDHTTPIKSASDGFFHQDIQPSDILVWPTNLGWMMGPWIIFATLINQGTLGLYHDVPTKRGFGEFVQNAKVTILGTVPALVAQWHHTRCMEGLNWQSIRLFTSTAECSNPEDMFYLMYLANYKPIIEYCGGTETGGGYITSTLLDNNWPSVFTTPAMGIDFVLVDEGGELTDDGEVYLLPPSIGLSTQLLNADHHEVYYAHVPQLANRPLLRRHGDHLLRLSNGHYCALGRSDDTMKLGGIKISSIEIERALAGIDAIDATAAIAVTKSHYGPSYLVIYAATQTPCPDRANIKKLMQARINAHLNPLFKIDDVVFVQELPKTASNKTLRRTLRKEYQAHLAARTNKDNPNGMS